MSEKIRREFESLGMEDTLYHITKCLLRIKSGNLTSLPLSKLNEETTVFDSLNAMLQDKTTPGRSLNSGFRLSKLHDGVPRHPPSNADPSKQSIVAQD